MTISSVSQSEPVVDTEIHVNAGEARPPGPELQYRHPRSDNLQLSLDEESAEILEEVSEEKNEGGSRGKERLTNLEHPGNNFLFSGLGEKRVQLVQQQGCLTLSVTCTTSDRMKLWL